MCAWAGCRRTLDPAGDRSPTRAASENVKDRATADARLGDTSDCSEPNEGPCCLYESSEISYSRRMALVAVPHVEARVRAWCASNAALSAKRSSTRQIIGSTVCVTSNERQPGSDLVSRICSGR